MRARLVLVLMLAAACGKSIDTSVEPAGPDASAPDGSTTDASVIFIDGSDPDRSDASDGAAPDASDAGTDHAPDADAAPLACTTFTESFPNPSSQAWTYLQQGWLADPGKPYFDVPATADSMGTFQSSTAAMPFPTRMLTHATTDGCALHLHLKVRILGVPPDDVAAPQEVIVTFARVVLVGANIDIVRLNSGVVQASYAGGAPVNVSAWASDNAFHMLDVVVPANGGDVPITVDGLSLGTKLTLPALPTHIQQLAVGTIAVTIPSADNVTFTLDFDDIAVN